MKKYFLTGLALLLPLALTLMVVIFLFDFFTTPFVNIVGPLIDFIQIKLHVSFPTGLTLFLSRLLALVFLCIFILLLGMVMQVFVVKNLIEWSEKIMMKIPIVRAIYKGSRDIFKALFSTGGKKAFKRAVMMPFPSKPNYCVGFEAGEVPQECQEKVSARLVTVFAPTAPHPISGFVFLVPEPEVEEISMTNEEVVKFLVSCGMIVPEDEEELQKGNE